MRFWEPSAIVPLFISEPFSRQASELLGSKPDLVAWWGSRVECLSALRRRERKGDLDAGDVRVAIERLEALAGGWTEVLPTDAVRAGAERALAVHPLRSADALQLAAALTWRRNPSQHPEFVCLDERLRDAAAREGFAVLPSP